MDKISGFFSSIATKEGIISLVFVLIVCVVLYFLGKNKGKGLSTRDVVAIGIGAALYAALSMISLPIGPNTSFRIAVALLVIFGSIFGPVVGFLVGFIGHALNDALMYGSVWWSWVFLSAIMGLFGGLITLHKGFDVLSGKASSRHFILLYVYSIVSIFVASLVAYAGDVFLYGEPADKVWLQIGLASVSNFAVIGIIGIPVVYALVRMRSKNTGLRADM